MAAEDSASAAIHLASSEPNHSVVDPLRDIVIVHGDGSVTQLPGRYRPVA